MTATGVIRAPGDGWVWDETEGKSVPDPGATLYTGRMRLQRINQATTALAAGQTVTVGTHVGAVPWDVDTITPGCTVTVTTSADPQLVDGRRFTITSVEQSTLVTARRFWANEVVST